MSGYGSHLGQSGRDAADLRTQQIAEIKQYLQQNPGDLEAIAQECAESPEYFQILLNMENVAVTKVLGMHNAMQIVKKRKEQSPSPEQLQEIIDFIKPNTSFIFDLSEVSGIAPGEIADIFQNQKGSTQSVTCLYRAIQEINAAKTQQTSGKQI